MNINSPNGNMSTRGILLKNVLLNYCSLIIHSSMVLVFVEKLIPHFTNIRQSEQN